MFTDKGVDELLAVTIKFSLYDLYRKTVIEEQAPKNVKDKHKWMIRVNKEIEKNRESARLFFKSKLFKLSGVNLEYIKREYLKKHPDLL